MVNLVDPICGSGYEWPMTVSTAGDRETPALDHACWYAVNTLPHREFRAKGQLENQDFRVFLPQRLKTVRHARKLTNIQAPFFPRYHFIELDLTIHRWRSVNGTFGVNTLVMQGERPLPVPHGIVETMLASVGGK